MGRGRVKQGGCSLYYLFLELRSVLHAIVRIIAHDSLSQTELKGSVASDKIAAGFDVTVAGASSS